MAQAFVRASMKVRPMTSLIDIFDRYIRLLKNHDAMQGIWLTGSYGRNDYDQYSDLDITTCTDNPEAIAQTFFDLCQTDSEIIFTKNLPSGTTINMINAQWQRCDITFINQQALNHLSQNTIHPIFDPHDLTQSIPETSISKNPVVDIQNHTEEFIRMLGLLPVVLHRQEYVVAQSGASLLKEKLIQLMLLINHTQPKRGALSLKKSLSTDQYTMLLNMPAMDTTPDSIIDVHTYIARHFLPLAKTLYQTHGMEWPHNFEAATLVHLEKELGLTALA